MEYLRKYYSDDSFDNNFVDDNLKDFWKAENKHNLMPLRNWELDGKYQYPKSLKVSKNEFYLIVYYTLPTILALIFCLAVIFIDVQFAEVSIFNRAEQTSTRGLYYMIN